MHVTRLPRSLVLVTAAAILLVHASGTVIPSSSRVQGIRFWSFGDVTRIAIETTGSYKLAYDQIENPSRLYFDLDGIHAPSTSHRGLETIQVGDQRIKQIRLAEIVSGKLRIVFDLEGPVEVVSSQLVNPDRLMIEVRPKGTSLPALAARNSASTPESNSNANVTRVSVPVPAPARAEQDDAPAAPVPEPRRVTTTPSVAGASAAKRDSSGDRSLVRVFGLKLGRVVIDAGHGGKDTGTIGPNGLMEKELVLDVALRLGKLIAQQLGAEVVYTRSSDIFIPLEERTKLANDQKADLFISVHANSSPESSATGVETYYFNLTSDRKGLDLATRENASAGSSISDLNDMLHRAVLQAKLEESREFAQKVQEALWINSTKMNNKAHDRGVRQAPFVVLIGAMMPSILAEIGFVSNPHDEKLMKRTDQRDKIAQALLRGVTQYANSLSHTQMARVGTD